MRSVARMPRASNAESTGRAAAWFVDGPDHKKNCGSAGSGRDSRWLTAVSRARSTEQGQVGLRGWRGASGELAAPLPKVFAMDSRLIRRREHRNREIRPP